MVMAFAEHLAARGVLVPPALTDDKLLACEVDQETRQSPVERAEAAASFRERPKRFARGEGDPRQRPAASRGRRPISDTSSDRTDQDT